MSQASIKKRKVEQDESYFGSYADVSIHEEMIADTVRTESYRRAIFNNKDNIEGKVVLDVGAGTGVLSVFCAQAGARKVYAVEASSIAEQAVMIIRQNKLEDKVEVIKGALEQVELPEQVDIIVSEWMGYALLHESMLNSVIFARDRWLKPGGLMLPNKAEIFITPISDILVEERLSFWSTIKSQYGVDMSCMMDFARKCILSSSEINIKPVSVEDVLSHPAKFAEIDLSTVTINQLSNVNGCFRIFSFGSASLSAFCIFFTVTFPGLCPLVLSTSPFNSETHWKQTVLYLDQDVRVTQDTVVEGKVMMYPSEESPRHICIQVDYTIGNEKKRSKTFSITDGNAHPENH